MNSGRWMATSTIWVVSVVVIRTPIGSSSKLRGPSMIRRATCMILLVGVCAPSPVAAQILDRIEVIQSRSTAEIHVVFTTRVIYQSHFPAERGNFVRVDLVLPQLDKSENLRRERLPSPPSTLLPEFMVSFPDRTTSTTKSLMIQFRKPVAFKVRSARDRTSIIISVPLNTGQPAEATGSSPRTSTTLSQREIRKAADDLMARGRAALMAGEYEKATLIFIVLLDLPNNQHSRDAQELIGVARERNNELEEAQVEYELYLLQYPDSEGAVRVRQRLTALIGTTPKKPTRKSFKKPRAPSEVDASVFGSLSQYYFWGRTESITETINGGIESRLRQSGLDQSLVVSTLNLTGRVRTPRYDTRVVLFGTHNLDRPIQPERESEFRLRRAYVKHEDKKYGYMAQIGRQFGSFGGVLTPYDGAWVRYGVLPKLGVSLVGGLPQEDPVVSNLRLDLGHYFFGGDVDFGPIARNWSGDGYFIYQIADGIVDRQAVGGELRYASNRLSAFSFVDYDLSYDVLNIATLNGTFQTQGGTLLTWLVDRRLTPALQTKNGLLATGMTSVKAALRAVGEEQLRRHARALTAESDLLQVGVTYPLTTRWQLGADLSYSSISGTDAAGVQPAVPGPGDTWSYTARAVGNNFLIRNHTLAINATYIGNPDFQAQSLSVNSLARFGESWQVDTSVNAYHQLDDNDLRLIRVTPSVRLGYRWRSNMLFEAEAGVEQAYTIGPNQLDSSLRQFFFVGYVWEH